MALEPQGLNVARPKSNGAVPRTRDIKLGSTRPQELWNQMKGEAGDMIAGFIEVSYGESPKVSDIVNDIKLDKDPDLTVGSRSFLRKASLALIAGDELLFGALRNQLAEKKLEQALALEMEVVADRMRYEEAAENMRVLSITEKVQFDRDLEDLKLRRKSQRYIEMLAEEARAAVETGDFSEIEDSLSLARARTMSGKLAAATAASISQVQVMVSEAKAIHRGLEINKKRLELEQEQELEQNDQ